MKARLIMLTLLAFTTAVLLAFRFRETKSIAGTSPTPAISASKTKNIIRCGPDWESLKTWIEEVDIPPIAGAGNYKWKITTANDSAQFYFNQGINMYYSFHIIEAMASFKKAARFDPACAMLHWAQALAYGPNINDLGYTASPDALAAINRAVELASGKITTKEKMLIGSMASRYSADSTQTRATLNQSYARLMKDAYQNFPADPDMAALYADALMLQHPWDLWKNDGTPKPWTPEIRNVLEKLLAKTPNHPGANHYYIHVMEPSPYAAKAIPSADRLGKLTPGLSHTVHMPSHIYLRTGNYTRGAEVNEKAVASYKKIIPFYAPVTGNDFLYLIHNLHMQTNNAMLAGRSAYSVKSAQETANSIPKDYLSIPGALGNYVQYIYMTPVLVDVRFGRWKELLARTQPDPTQVYANILYYFGKGMAYTQQSKQEEALRELTELKQLMKDSSLLIPFTPFSPAIDGAIIAEQLLAGMIALHEKKYDESILAFTKAVQTEENMVYNEPRDWLLNPKHYLGFAYLQAARFTEAEKIFRKDLQNNNENIWALNGIYGALTGQQSTAVLKFKQRVTAALKNADMNITDPVIHW
jgi:tetratricopeptide (TPR) repeat protein